MACWGTRYVSPDRLGSWIGYIGLDWAFHIASFCITNWSTIYIAGLNRAWGSTLHIANLRLTGSLALYLCGLGLAWSLALHLGGLRLAGNLAFHLGNLNWAWCRALHDLHSTRGLKHHLALGTGGWGRAEGGTLHTALGDRQATLNLLLVTHGSYADV